MTRTLYDLAAKDPEMRFSPFCWRAKMAMRHKGLDFETIPIIRSTFLLDIYNVVADRDRAYFRESREKLFGGKLEELAMERSAGLKALAQVLQPAEATLNVSRWLAGDEPSYADYCLFGSLQWGRVLSSEPIVSPDGAVGRWFERMLGLFDGYARQVLTIGGEAARREAG
jgi:glutathione S-transferase